jgi:hypothetical protein
VAFLTDIHHSLVVPPRYIEHVVNTTNALSPDIVILGGDYVTAGPKYKWLDGESYIFPCFDILKNLKAKLGLFAVTGNHDTHAGLAKIHTAMGQAGFQKIDNGGEWLTLQGHRLRICGVGDMRTQNPNTSHAFGDAAKGDAVILVSHNPDLAEEQLIATHTGDVRPGLMLSGHTHGGQVVLPLIGAPFVGLCSNYGQKYRYGIVQGPRCKVLVSCGVGVLPPAVRLNCPPEVMLITLIGPATRT